MGNMVPLHQIFGYLKQSRRIQKKNSPQKTQSKREMGSEKIDFFLREQKERSLPRNAVNSA